MFLFLFYIMLILLPTFFLFPATLFQLKFCHLNYVSLAVPKDVD